MKIATAIVSILVIAQGLVSAPAHGRGVRLPRLPHAHLPRLPHVQPHLPRIQPKIRLQPRSKIPKLSKYQDKCKDRLSDEEKTSRSQCKNGKF